MEIGDVINVDVINVSNQPKAPTLSIMDLGKQLLECAKDGQTTKVHDLMCRGAPFTTDWVCVCVCESLQTCVHNFDSHTNRIVFKFLAWKISTAYGR